MKKFLLPLLFMAIASVANAALTALHIHTSTHGVITILLDDEPTLTFNDNRSITVEVGNPDSDTDPIQIDFDDIESCEYGEPDDYNGASVDLPQANPLSGITVRVESSGITFGNIPEGIPVEIFNLSGITLGRNYATGGAYTLCRSDFQKGIYVVRIGAFTTKVSL